MGVILFLHYKYKRLMLFREASLLQTKQLGTLYGYMQQLFYFKRFVHHAILIPAFLLL
jgi:hypothetical protein